jgi:hypothetical protein
VEQASSAGDSCEYLSLANYLDPILMQFHEFIDSFGLQVKKIPLFFHVVLNVHQGVSVLIGSN